jgi:hypothetical protein
MRMAVQYPCAIGAHSLGCQRDQAEGGDHGEIMNGGGGDHESVPDGILEAQLFPDMEDDAERIDDATGDDQPERDGRQMAR